MARYNHPWWSIDPSPWTVVDDDDEGLVTIAPGSADAALQISAYSKDESVTRRDVEEFAADIQPLPNWKGIHLNSFQGLQTEWVDDEGAWQHWLLYTGPLLLYVTYNCEPGLLGRDADTVRRILSSLQPDLS